jgi:hypothetical protein
MATISARRQVNGSIRHTATVGKTIVHREAKTFIHRSAAKARHRAPIVKAISRLRRLLRHNPRSFYEENPQSQYYQPGWRPDPSINILNARATLRWSHFEVATFVNNALNSQPSLALASAPTVIRERGRTQ